MGIVKARRNICYKNKFSEDLPCPDNIRYGVHALGCKAISIKWVLYFGASLFPWNNDDTSVILCYACTDIQKKHVLRCSDPSWTCILYSRWTGSHDHAPKQLTYLLIFFLLVIISGLVSIIRHFIHYNLFIIDIIIIYHYLLLLFFFSD